MDCGKKGSDSEKAESKLARARAKCGREGNVSQRLTRCCSFSPPSATVIWDSLETGQQNRAVAQWVEMI